MLTFSWKMKFWLTLVSFWMLCVPFSGVIIRQTSTAPFLSVVGRLSSRHGTNGLFLETWRKKKKTLSGAKHLASLEIRIVTPGKCLRPFRDFSWSLQKTRLIAPEGSGGDSSITVRQSGSEDLRQVSQCSLPLPFCLSNCHVAHQACKCSMQNAFLSQPLGPRGAQRAKRKLA